MASIVSVGFENNVDEMQPLSNSDSGDLNNIQRKNIEKSQAGIVELSSLIANPGLKRAESSEILHLTLHQCARDGNFENMRRLLQSLTGNVKKKVNSHDEEELSALHYAARYNHYPIVKLLVEYNANVQDTDEEGATPLHFAARYKRMRLIRPESTDNINDGHETGDEETDGQDVVLVPQPESTVENSVILYLVDRGADPNARDIYGCTPLHFAAMRGNEVATKELLSCKDINIKAVDKQHMTALHMGASHNEPEVCRMVIEAGANLRSCDEDMATPLHYACMEGSLSVAQMLFEAGEKQDGWVTVSQMVTDQDKEQNNALHLAVENLSYDVVNLCIEKGADVNVPRSNYSTPLHLAAVAGDVRIVELLVDNNARIDALDINQSTPLHKAAGYNHADVVEFLLERGAKINKRDKDNFTPLLIAACNGHMQTIKTLLDKGADVYAVDKNDKTAIYWAAEEDQTSALEVLLENRKARELIDSSDRYDNTALHIASQKGYLNCVRILIDNGANQHSKNEEERSAVQLAADAGRTAVVRELVRRNKMVINDEDEDSNTALHLASLAGHNKVVLALIEAGADIEARNCTLWTPLDCAAAKGWAKTCRVLLEADAPIDPMDKTRTTPLHLASSRGHVPVVNLLLAWHANVSQRDKDGNNCLDLAIDAGNKEAAMAIISSPKWKEALRNETLDLNTGHRVTPMRKLIKKMPEVAEKVFNQCTTSNSGNPDQFNYEITFNYEYLDDMYANWRETDTSDGTSTFDSVYDEDHRLTEDAIPYSNDSGVLKKNHPLTIMVKFDQEDLLAHPLVTSLLNHKWNSFGRTVYYINLVIYCVFLAFLTAYVCNVTPPYQYPKQSNMYNNFYKEFININPDCMQKEKLQKSEGLSCNNGSCSCEEMRNVTTSMGISDTTKTFLEACKWIIIVLAAFNIIRELGQMITARLNYLGWENLIEWVTYVSAIILVVDFDQCQVDTGWRSCWQWRLAAIAVFLGWIDLVLFIRKMPRFGIYVVMFTDILYTFAQFFPVFFLFIIAFGLAFFVLMQDQAAFATVGLSLIKTTVMMVGEFEYGDVFLAEIPSYLYISYIVFVAFIFLMAIIIMNLLVGLAVDDIKAVQDQAVLKRLAMQVELALEVESMLPQFIRRRFVVRSRTILPNQVSRNPLKRCLHIDTELSSAAITKALNPEWDEWEILQENQEKCMKQVIGLRQRMKVMSQTNERLQSMLEALIKHHSVDYQDEDFQDEVTA